jgi:hypothetical protein
MQQFAPLEELFKGRHFGQEIVVLCVRWYLSFKLSYRDLVAMMAERGINFAWPTRQLCGGYSTTRQNLRNGGSGSRARSEGPGEWMRPA